MHNIIFITSALGCITVAQSNAVILLVEDHADIRRLVRMTLEMEPCTVLEAGDVQEATALLNTCRPDLALLDVMLPGPRNGLSLCAELRASFPDLPILMLSALHAPSDRDAGSSAGATDYLSKPFSPLGLLDRVRALLPSPASQP